MLARLAVSVLFAGGLALLAGCDTFERRVQAKPAAYAALTPAQREQLKRGSISIGDTADMVYLALGEPDEKWETRAASGLRTVWVYNTYRRERAAPVGGAFRRDLVYDPITHRYVIFYAPLQSDALDYDVPEESIRVTFRDGKVVEIEQPKT